eukprot:350568-Chlamydomonas_euryale.AAC.1
MPQRCEQHPRRRRSAGRRGRAQDLPTPAAHAWRHCLRLHREHRPRRRRLAGRPGRAQNSPTPAALLA